MPKFLMTNLLLFAVLFGLTAQSHVHEPLAIPMEGDVVRCYSAEYNQHLENNSPNRTTTDEFEKWMSAQRKELATQRLTQRDEDPVVYTIPIIVHVIYRLENEPQNISSDLVYAQIEQLNDDFRKVGTYGSSDYIDAADCHVEFCPALYDEDGNELAEPGINRISVADRPELGGGIYTGLVEFDDLVKRQTYWDPDLYMNFWSADIGPVLLGYAQFPDAPCLGGIGGGNGDRETDGVVCNYNTIGGEDARGSNAPYDLGRTATHEVGHWIGLRHIWGDTACDGDDFVEDTPNAADSNGGCTPEENTCDDSGNDYFAETNPNPYPGPGGTYPEAADPNDQVRNYMDYSEDECMNIFTNIQRDRMRIVMGELTGRDCEGGSPRRASLALSNKCTPADQVVAQISFNETSSSVTEGTACAPQTIDVTLDITNAPDADVIVTAVAAGTAVAGVDYEFVTNPITFTSGMTDEKSFQINVLQDGALDGDKTLDLTFTTTGGTVQVSPVRIMHSMTILDDDLLPSDGKNISQDLIYSEDFEGVDAGDDWNSTLNDPASPTSWSVGTPVNGLGLLTTSVYVSLPAVLPPLVGGYAYNELPSNIRYESPAINASGYSNITLTFDVLVEGESSGGTNYDYGTTWYSIDEGANWIKFGEDLIAIKNGGVRTFALPVEANNALTLRVAFQWENDLTTANLPPLSFDNVEVRGDESGSSDITVDAAKTSEFNVLANQTVYFYDADQNIMAALENGATDLECVSVETLTAGTGTEANIDFSAVSAGSEATSKTFRINAGASGAYKVWLYYTDVEIANWINTHGTSDLTIDDFILYKTSAATAAAATAANTVTSATVYEAYNDGTSTGYRFSGDFSGFSVFGGMNGNVVLPLDMIGFSGQAVDKTVDLKWLTTNEINVDHFVVERQDNNIFRAIGSPVVAKGAAQNTYNFIDAQPQSGDNFYRLKIVDQNGKYKYSNVINVNFVSTDIVSNIFPNPATDKVIIALNTAVENPRVKVYNQLGQAVTVQVLNKGTQIELNTQSLSNGVYYIELTNNAGTNLHSVVISK